MKHFENPFACGACPKTFSVSKSLLRHVQTKHSKPCIENENKRINDIAIDQSKTDKDDSQSRSFKLEHFPLKSSEEIENNIKLLYNLTDCVSKFNNFPSNINLEVSQTTAQNNVRKANIQDFDKETSIFDTKEQSAIFKESEHMLHDESAKTPYQETMKQNNFSCKYCTKSFHSGFVLKRHEQTHSDEKPFSCKLCKQSCHKQEISCNFKEEFDRFNHFVLHDF